MLIEFSVKNWRSFREQQTLSLVGAKDDSLLDSHSFDSATPATTRLLRSAMIYGPNASGKSNLIKAIQTMQKIVLASASEGQRNDPLPVVSFLLDSHTKDAPTEFETIFVADGVRYQYGFSATTTRILEEWLFAFPNGRPQRWFSRSYMPEKGDYDWKMGHALPGKKQLWQDSTRENALFLSTAIQLNSKPLQPVYDWFKNILRIALNTEVLSPSLTLYLCTEPEQRSRVLDFLMAADLDIHDINIKSEKMSLAHLPLDMPDELKSIILTKMKDGSILNIQTIHHTSQGEPVLFDVKEESDGTQKLFAFAGPFLDILEHGRVLFIDELNDHLHPKMVQFLVQLFHNNATNPKNAQLVFTTHETSIMDQEHFRRDQVWFCEKTADQATKLYPLTNFHPRKGREDLRSNYLDGLYGALPYLRNPYLRKGR